MKLRVLCLHGYRQDSSIFREKSGGWRKLLKNAVEFVFVDAPHIVPHGEQNPDNVQQWKSWWFSECDPKAFYSKQYSNTCIGFEESVKVIDEICSSQGPFDGILGFSQGAAMAALICAKITEGSFAHRFKFALLFAAFESQNSNHEYLYSKKIDIPSLHVIGESDQVIYKELSEKLAQRFDSARVIYHKGGHCVPSTSNNKAAYLEFVDKFIICSHSLS